MLQPNQTTEGAKRESYWSMMLVALRYRNFRLVWLGSITEHSGEWMQIATILWLVNEMTHSPLMLTIVGSARFLPSIIFPVIGGVVADRVNRRSLLIASELALALVSIGLVALVVTGVIAVWHLIVANLLTGVAISFNHPARFAIVPNLVKKEHLMNAISVDSMSVQASRLFAMPITGYLLIILGAWPIFVLRALGCFLAVFWLLWARVPPTPPTARRQAPWHNVTEGLSYLRGNTSVLGLMILFLVPWLVVNTNQSFLPVFAENILNIGAVGYGYFQAAPGLGAIFALIGLTLLTYYRGKIKLLIGAGALLGISLLGFSASRWVFLSLPLLVVTGGAMATFMAVNTTLIQTHIPDEVRGRVMSWREIAMGLGPAGSMLFGAIAQYTGVPISLGLLGGIVLIASLLLMAFLPRFRSLE